ncbi:HD domain-containing protein [Pantoea phytobeneficialis]|uniref:GTP pyrophosphokinase n=1 Tax=Pantoea phytobeneficialis TaxID=2052056 RepID=A0AAP9KR64_9GAMM|nr:HD domain-containing protein [Pantoea phytobeneficialis]MDO6408333.1 HD domain-containing protein [Pantoea phytobeneficialis]QGR08638.1 GTP pyrophosphokinase [Pantoea phytobeneficialis]
MRDSLEDQARHYATQAHAEAGQRRKYTDEPYIVHPAAVVELVRSVTDDEAMLAAAWLHDTVEDTASTLADITRLFGPRVAELVDMLTDSAQPQAKNRAARKLAYFRHTAQASPEAQTIKLADIIDNTRAIVQFDADFARVYLVEKQIQIQLLNEGDKHLWQQADNIIRQGLTQLAQPPHSVPESWFVKQAAKYGVMLTNPDT